MILFMVISLLSCYIGLQVSVRDLKCFSRKINYKIGGAQILCLIFFIISLALICYDVTNVKWWLILYVPVAIFVSAFWEWVLSKICSKSLALNITLRLFFIITFAYVILLCNEHIFLPFVLYGFYIRNCPFGVVHGKDLYLSSFLKRRRFHVIKGHNTIGISLPDFGYVGLRQNINLSSNICDVTMHGIVPNTSEDILDKIQQLIDDVGKRGGGVIYFPKGKYYFNRGEKHSFLQINYSNISIRGEVNEEGKPLSELICCNDTLCGIKNPWLSPFFITTGERIQKSNIFFGIQFKNKKNLVTRSGSLADPGSDGEILTPVYATKITGNALSGSDILEVEDSSTLGTYIIIGMYNTSKDGNLIKEILGVDNLRPEWKTSLRAGEEVAPSFQWLIGVKEKIAKTRIRLSRPLLRNIDLKYNPCIYNVDMLENIMIRDIKISSGWNGLFRHHGFPVYYNVSQAQKMDYGWNGINMKRVAQGSIQNVIIENFTNPLYVMDSRNITCKDISIKGYDGHQGIKIYGHACDNLFVNITFYCHFADMLGGEGNSYGNVFSQIYYMNPCFKPVDFDFHGFSEGPFSPPAYNLFECIYGFRHIKTAAAMYNLPGCAQYNTWWNIMAEGEKKDSPLFICLPYVKKNKLQKILSSVSRMLITSIQNKNFKPNQLIKIFRQRSKEIDASSLKIEEHQLLYHNIFCIGFKTSCKLYPQNDIYNISQHDFVSPTSLVKSQQESIK